MTPVDEDNLDQAIHILARAFSNDPVMNWMFPDKEDLSTFFRITLPVFTPHQLSYLHPQGFGAATWLGPEQELSWPFSLSNVIKALKFAGPGGTWRFLQAGIKTEKHHPREPHYYLFAVGALPECTGQGIGTALMKHVLKMCDEQSTPAYLENSKAENLAFYEGHGFKVIQEISFAKAAPPLWLMWREPLN